MGTPNGFGVTLQNMFGAWAKENLRFFYNRAEYHPQPKSSGIDFRFAPVPASLGRRFAIPKILGLRPEWRGQYSNTWLRWNLRGFRPDLVFSSVHSIHSIRFGDWIARQTGKPHALHVMDEPFHGVELGEAKELLGRTCSFMTISDTMRSAYLERFGQDSKVFHNGAEPSFFNLSPANRKEEAQIRLRFVGNLYQLQHFQAIEDIAEAVSRFNQNSPKQKAVLEIFGNESPSGCSSRILKAGEVFFHGPIPLEQRMETIAWADILVIPFTFDTGQFESYRLSIPTKLPENLATGIPVFLYGPKGMAATDLCLRHGLGTAQTERSIPAVLDFLQSFASDPGPFRSKALEAKRFAKENLSAEATSRRFLKHMSELCQQAA